MHPANVLFKGEVPPRTLPVCDHYCGTEPRMRKAISLQNQLGPVFDITLDCEDGAPVGQELEHARLCAELIKSPDNQFNRIGARIHDPSHPRTKDDIETFIKVSGEKIAFITIPKVESAYQTRQIIDVVNSISKDHQLSREIPIQVLIETHGALTDVFEIAAIPQVESLSFGLMDFVSAHHGAIPSFAMDRGQFDHPLVARAMLEISAACHAFGKIPSHNVCTNIHDANVIRADAQIAKDRFGYMRKWSIHPNQILHLVDIFNPSNEEAEEALAILCDAADANWGPIQFAGKLHDRASYRYYWLILQKALTAGKKFPQATKRGWDKQL